MGGLAASDGTPACFDSDAIRRGLSRNQVVVAQITTTAHHLACEVNLTTADGMPKNCVVNCDVILTVPKNRLTNRITRLSPQKMANVNQALKFAMDLS